MDRRVSIPVNGRIASRYASGGSGVAGDRFAGQRLQVRPADGGGLKPGAIDADDRADAKARPEEQATVQAAVDRAEPAVAPKTGLEAELETWRDQSLRLQAEMDNYRKRQRQRAQEEIEAQHRRLLGEFLRVVDDLDRALSTPEGGEPGLRKGIELTRRTALQLMEKEGVERIKAEGQAFDPAWHEAVATVRGAGPETAPNTVVQVIEPGYRLKDQLLRPAKVVVAV